MRDWPQIAGAVLGERMCKHAVGGPRCPSCIRCRWIRGFPDINVPVKLISKASIQPHAEDAHLVRHDGLAADVEIEGPMQSYVP